MHLCCKSLLHTIKISDQKTREKNALLFPSWHKTFILCFTVKVYSRYIKLWLLPGSLHPLQLVHLNEELVRAVVHLGPEPVPHAAHHLHVLSDVLGLIEPHLHHVWLVVADLVLGDPLKLLKPVPSYLLNVPLL
jgi:hypothetical protein